MTPPTSVAKDDCFAALHWEVQCWLQNPTADSLQTMLAQSGWWLGDGGAYPGLFSRYQTDQEMMISPRWQSVLDVARWQAERFWRACFSSPPSSLQETTQGYLSEAWLTLDPHSAEEGASRRYRLAEQLSCFFAASSCYYLLRACGDCPTLRREIVDAIGEERLLMFFQTPIEHEIRSKAALPENRLEELVQIVFEQLGESCRRDDREGNRQIRAWVNDGLADSWGGMVAQIRTHVRNETMSILRSSRYAYLQTPSLAEAEIAEDRLPARSVREAETSYADNLAETLWPTALSATVRFPEQWGTSAAVWLWLAGGCYDARQAQWPQIPYSHAPELREALEEWLPQANPIRDHFQKHLGPLMVEAGLLEALREFCQGFFPQPTGEENATDDWDNEQAFLQWLKQRGESLGSAKGALGWRMFQMVSLRNAQWAGEQQQLEADEPLRELVEEDLKKALVWLRREASEEKLNLENLAGFACRLVDVCRTREDWLSHFQQLAAENEPEVIRH